MPVSPADAERVAVEIARLYADAERILLEKIARRIARGIEDDGYYERKLREIQQLRAEIEAEIARLRAEAQQIAERIIGEAYTNGVRQAELDLRGLERTVAISLTFGVTNQAAIQALVLETLRKVESTHLAILRQVEDAYREVIAEAVRPAVAGVETRREAAQRALNQFADRGITGFVDSAGRNWELAAYTEMATRTAIGRAYLRGHINTLMANGYDLVIVSDSPEECPLCVPAGTLVMGPAVQWRCRLEYSGDLISIRTAGGKHLSGTPDHTVLTPFGWRRLKDLNPGDQIISYRGQQWHPRVVPDDIQVPTPVEQVGKAVAPLLLAGPTRRDLDRNVAYRKVNVVWPDGLLLDELDATFAEPFGDLGLVGRLGLGSFGTGEGNLGRDLEGAAFAAGGRVGRLQHPATLFVSSVGPAAPHGLTPALAEVLRVESRLCEAEGLTSRTGANTGPSEVVGYRPAADPEHGAELLRALAGQIEADEIVSLSVRQFRGHVYDLQTAGGWYISNNIISHNCRPWEGKVLSLSGATRGYPTVAEATAAGLFHPSCVHRLGLYIPGLTLPMRDTANPEGYEERQRQRYIERTIRRWKRREAAAITPEEQRLARAKVREWQATAREFVDDTGRRRRYDRESITRAR